MKNYPRISVVIPVYNCEKYLDEAILSVLNQPYTHISIVLVDDGSSDSSPEICDRYAMQHDRIHVFHQKNSGVSSARNAGIEYVLNARPEACTDSAYIAFLDADDVWETGFLDEQVAKILNSGFDLIGYQNCNCNMKLVKTSSPMDFPNGVFTGGEKNVWLHSSQHFGAMFYSCELLRKYSIRFRDGLKYSEDKIFSLQCMYLADRIYQESRLMYLYRDHDSSAMGRRKFGIPYYQPILEAYVEMDLAMSRWETPERGQFRVGSICANQYAVSMMEEHFQNWRPKRVMDRFLEDHPEYVSIMKRQPPYEYLPRNMQYEAYEKNPGKFILKNNLLGVVKYIRRALAKIIK